MIYDYVTWRFVNYIITMCDYITQRLFLFFMKEFISCIKAEMVFFPVSVIEDYICYVMFAMSYVDFSWLLKRNWILGLASNIYILEDEKDSCDIKVNCVYIYGHAYVCNYFIMCENKHTLIWTTINIVIIFSITDFIMKIFVFILHFTLYLLYCYGSQFIGSLCSCCVSQFFCVKKKPGF